MSLAPAPALVSSRDFAICCFIGVVRIFNVPLFSKLERFIPNLGSSYQAAENSGIQFLHPDGNAGP